MQLIVNDHEHYFLAKLANIRTYIKTHMTTLTYFCKII